MVQSFAETFERLGRPLTDADGTPAAELAAAEERLGCRVPGPLRAFYQVAGRATDFIDRYDHFLPPAEWTREDGKLVFLAENQGVVVYGVEVNAGDSDPPVAMAGNPAPLEWHRVCGGCSEFLQVMLHWEGAFGGAMPLHGTASADDIVRSELERRLVAVGEVNEMWAYGRAGVAVCLVRWSDGWRLFVGAATVAALDALEDELGIAVSWG